MSRQFNYMKTLRMIYIVKEHLNLWEKLSMVVGFDSLSSINGSNETLGYESLPLSRVHSIGDEAPTLCHVACKEESSRERVCPIRN